MNDLNTFCKLPSSWLDQQPRVGQGPVCGWDSCEGKGTTPGLLPYTCAQPFSINTCISLIKQCVPGSESSASDFVHALSLLFIVESLNEVIVTHRHMRFVQTPMILWLIEGQKALECTAA